MLVGDALGRGMIDLLRINGTPDGYAEWVNGPFSGTLTDTEPSLDFDGGSLQTGIEWVVGGDPTDGSDDDGLVPVIDNTSDPDFFTFTYRRADKANTDTNTSIAVEYGNNLNGWTTAVAGADIVITSTNDAAAVGIDLVKVKIRHTLAQGGKLFVRLYVEVATP
jgi:hypothetical protein